MTEIERNIIEGTKEFAKSHSIHYDQMTENMILNALREQLTLTDVSSMCCDKCEDTGVIWSEDRLSAKTCGCK